MKYLELVAALSIFSFMIPPAIELTIRVSTSVSASILLTKEIAIAELEAGRFLAACADGNFKTLITSPEIQIMAHTPEYSVLERTLRINDRELTLLGVCK